MNKFIMMVGLPASGKSYIAKHISDYIPYVDANYVIVSSDSMRKELYGDENDQTHNNDLFTHVNNRIIDMLKSGVDVVYDATNIKKKYRDNILNLISNIDCIKYAVIVNTSLDECIYNNSHRERMIPVDVIERMNKNYTRPSTTDGFNVIIEINNNRL